MTFSFDWHNETLHQMLKLVAAYALALPVGWLREREAHSVGVRTFPLVAMASCAYILVAVPLGHPDIAAQSRVLQGLVAARKNRSSATATPSTPVFQMLAAVAVPCTLPSAFRMAPPPMKPMPATSPCSTRDWAVTSGCPSGTATRI